MLTYTLTIFAACAGLWCTARFLEWVMIPKPKPVPEEFMPPKRRPF